MALKPKKNKVFYVMGVSGCGKSTIAKMLAEVLSITFVDADDFHPATNIEKMQAGFPLNDEDRAEWLQAINSYVRSELSKTSMVIACSALKKRYRQVLSQKIEDQTSWIYLRGSFELIQSRMKARDHFMPASLLQSQFDALEEPEEAIVLNIEQAPELIIAKILTHLKD